MRSWLVGILGVLCFGVVGCLGSDIDLTDGDGDCEVGRTFFADHDGDGFGDPNDTRDACNQPVGYVTDDTDCDPINSEAYTGALELCGDKLDNDCVGGDPCQLSLVGHWSFTDPGGVTSTDLTGNALPGDLMNGLTNLPSDMLLFDGEDDYVEVADNLMLHTSVGTIAFWFNPTGVEPGVRQSMLSKDSNGNDQGGHFSFYITEANTLQVRLQSNQEDFDIETIQGVLNNQWYHVVFTYGGNEGMALIVNGTQVGVNGYTGGLQNSLEPMVIGAGTDNSGNQQATPISNPYQGIVADVRLYDRQLLGNEIQTLMVTTDPQ